MLAYQMTMKIEMEPKAAEETEAQESRLTSHRSKVTNGVDWKYVNPRAARKFLDSPYVFLAWQSGEDEASMVAVSRSAPMTAGLAAQEAKKQLKELGQPVLSCQAEDFHEITLTECCSCLVQGEINDLHSARRVSQDLGLEEIREQVEQSRRHNDYQLNEYLGTASCQSKEEALEHAEQIMGHTSLREELERIYHSGNRRCFASHPVHYLLHATSRQSALESLHLLVGSLYANGRLLSQRFGYFFDFDKRSDCCVKDHFDTFDYATVVVEMPPLDSDEDQKSRSSIDDDFFRMLTEEVKKQHDDTLFIFVLMEADAEEEEEDFWQGLAEFLTIIPLQEGSGNAQETRNYINHLAKLKEMSPFTSGRLAEFVPPGNYTATDAGKLFKTLCQDRLYHEFYPAYQNTLTHFSCQQEDTRPKGNPRQKLISMVGLENVKSLMNRIIAAHKMKKLRQEMNLKDTSQALHMVFTGNPGSAKTTVARLLAAILAEEEVLPTGAFIECGRSDLVGKYVGWTARIVRQRFREARGGVLFIDEAYALLEDKRSFGAEAINTIVQEMENHREDVLVIFAGYPESMEDFIESNEGLRSRIAFQVDFPDYSVEELCGILQFMARERGYRLNHSIIEKCRSYFVAASQQENFGNGRYVRKLLEDAIMRQAERLLGSDDKTKISRQMASSLRAEDFQPLDIKSARNKTQMGFSAGFAPALSSDLNKETAYV